MSVVNHTVELPTDVRHHLTMATALSWEAWDELTADEGWEEVVVLNVDDDGCSLTQREAVVRGHHIVIFPPVEDGRS